ncbi:hypothetical protein SAMD00019534_034340 [Acytostelium subglobosum LB1]|uniref:hypothetical protein n=1 Tax=Acytostelium subglobosum LB1 TaxID=1410327 RepID=UPI000644EC98|nr:hypothetical protein SAMD00019534_034340 [Acytostelium subglobosum LB1]GAM20259.1 hypothetical protein SAMD00019534_034340 [Acytostelium subglobosum LB1]|eukprot:XP_012759780.1 hypothetical protein SAMD00019534_034340 [Acytostelium subglobosum LB1]
MDILKYLDKHVHNDKLFNGHEFITAAKLGRVEAIKYILKHRVVEWRFLVASLERAVAGGHVEIAKMVNDQMLLLEIKHNKSKKRRLKLFKETVYPMRHHSYLDVAAESGSLEMVQWVHNSMPEVTCSERLFDLAAGMGCMDILQFLHQNRTEGGSQTAWDLAAMGGHLDVLKFLHEHRTEPFHLGTMASAARNGRMDIIQWLHDNGRPTNQQAVDYAAAGGHLDIVKWLLNNRTEGCSKMAMDNAAKNGHLHVVTYLHTHNTRGCSIYAMNYAAAFGRLEIVQFLHNHRTEGCDYNALQLASCNGHLNTIKFLIENRPQDVYSNITDSIKYAKKTDNPHIVEYLSSLPMYYDKVKFSIPPSSYSLSDFN